jgi:hypothetical protein
MRAARIAVLLAAACHASPPSPPPAAAPDAQAASCVERWLAGRDLNQYGDPAGTMYTGGTPLFDERTGKTTDRMEYLLRKHPDLKQACPSEVLKAP